MSKQFDHFFSSENEAMLEQREMNLYFMLRVQLIDCQYQQGSAAVLFFCLHGRGVSTIFKKHSRASEPQFQFI